MAKPWDITGDDLVRWSQQYDAPAVLPDLVRRLILATAPLSSISMAAHAGTRLPGWDGVVRSMRETAFCPDGLSVWELTVQDEKSKFDEDFTKRTNDPGHVAPSGATYVAVSARHFKTFEKKEGKHRWAAEQRAKGVWRDVRALNADDLATWLSRAPAVARWFAAQLRRPAGDIDDLESFLEGWSRRTRPPLPREIALAGEERRRLAEGVRGWARTAGRDSRPLRIHAHTKDEALVFAAAALATDASPEGEQVRSRTLIVRSEEALRWALASDADEPLIILPLLDRQATPTRTDGPMILPMEGPLPSGARDIVRLLPAPFMRFAEILTQAGVPEQEARRQAERSGGDLKPLQRLFGYVELPRWAEGRDVAALSAMLLVGEFQPDNQEDREVLRLLGADPREVELLCEHLRIGPDAPTHKEQARIYRSVWSWRAPDDAWNALVGQIHADTLRRFEAVIQIVLGARDPMLDFAAEEGVAPGEQGKTLRASGSLREGLARSLVRLALNDEALAILHRPRRGNDIAVVAVRDLLPLAWASWASLAGLLPLLAEAAPDTFLDCMEMSLREGDKGVAHLLSEKAFMGASPHTGLLWALEMLGWEETYMSRVADVLLKLSECGEELFKEERRPANWPVASLHKLIHFSFAQTRASVEARYAVLRRLASQSLGYEFIVGQINSINAPGFMMPAHPAQLRPWIPLDETALQERATREATGNASALVDLALEHAGAASKRWVKLLDASQELPEPLVIRIFDKLEATRQTIDDSDGAIWGGLRSWLHRSSSDENAWQRERDWYKRAAHLYYHVFDPPDLVVRYSFLFKIAVRLADHGGLLHRRDGTLKSRRLDALKHIWSEPEPWTLLERFLIAVDGESTGRSSGIVGEVLGQTDFAPEIEERLLTDPSGVLGSLLPSYIAGKLEAPHPPQWLEGLLRRIVDERGVDAAAQVVKPQDTTKELWSTIDKIGEPLRSAYWQTVRYVHVSDPDAEHNWDYAISRLVGAGNLGVALDAIERAGPRISTTEVIATLRALRVSSAELARQLESDFYTERLEKLLQRAKEDPGDGADFIREFEAHLVRVSRYGRSAGERLAAIAERDFVKLIKQIYRREGEDKLPPGPERAKREEEALAAHEMLESWSGYPGQSLGSNEREDHLYTWAKEVLELCVDEGRGAVGASEVARVLARAQTGDDGHWPCVAARRLLELDEFPHLAGGLRVAKHNARGGVRRSLGEGGKQERVIATDYRDDARLLRLSWPRTADMLERLAQDHDSEAVEEDAAAQATLREYGAEPGDFGSRPAAPSPSPNRRIVSPGIVQLDSIEIRDFTCFDKFELPLKPPVLDCGQWLILLGDNGRGKSSILRAIALTLAGTNVTQSMLGLYPAPLIRTGQTSSECRIKSGSQLLSVRLTDEITSVVATCDPPNGARPLLFGYGCRRGSTLGGNEVADLGGPSSSIITLFSETARLIPAPSWLQRLKLRALQDPKHEHVFSTVTAKLCSLLRDVERMDVVDDQVWAIAPKLGGRLPLSALSDGYLTTLGWLVDLIARWLHWAEQMSLDLTGNFFERMEGLVLLDEIDLHLHPLWQREIIGKLRDAFPRLSFVVTTHNPLTLLGAEASEIVVLRAAADKSGRSEALQIDLPLGIRADRVLTGEWFGLPSTVDDETADLFNKHQQMLLAKVPANDPERLRIEKLLRPRLGTFGDTSLDRMALEVAADLMRESQPNTAEEREKMRQTLKERVRARRAEEQSRGGVKS